VVIGERGIPECGVRDVRKASKQVKKTRIAKERGGRVKKKKGIA